MNTMESAQRILLEALAIHGACDSRKLSELQSVGKRDYSELLRDCIDTGLVRVAKRKAVVEDNLAGIFPSKWEITLKGRSTLAALQAGDSRSSGARSITLNVRNSQVALGDGNIQTTEEAGEQ